jgi:hypothetical protein
MVAAAARRRWAAALLGMLFIAALLRLACLRAEPWLDEVWSIGIARRASSAAAAFFSRDDNNNPLNTLWLYVVRGSRDWAAYRVLSLSTGLLTVALLGWDAEEPARGLLAALLAAVSVPMVLHSTEARGYMPMAFFALACFLILRSKRALGSGRGAVFGLCAALAFLCHATFVYVAAALFFNSAAGLPKDRRLKTLLRIYGPPTLILLILAAIRGPILIGGAARNGYTATLLRTLALWSGAPSGGIAGVAGAAALAGLVAWDLFSFIRERRNDFVFFAVLFLGALLFVAIDPFPFERHFFACLPFVLMLAADALLRLFRRGGAGPAVATGLTLLLLSTNVIAVSRLATLGRGHYLEAVQRMAADSTGEVVTVSSDHDFRNGTMLEFYGMYMPSNKRLQYVPAQRRQAQPPDWFIRHDFDPNPRPAAVLAVPETGVYRLVEIYPYSGLAGWAWILYRRVDTDITRAGASRFD